MLYCHVKKMKNTRSAKGGWVSWNAYFCSLIGEGCLKSPQTGTRNERLVPYVRLAEPIQIRFETDRYINVPYHEIVL